MTEELEKLAYPEFMRGMCSCGCDGDYTDHSMRQGERGMW